MNEVSCVILYFKSCIYKCLLVKCCCYYSYSCNTRKVTSILKLRDSTYLSICFNISLRIPFVYHYIGYGCICITFGRSPFVHMFNIYHGRVLLDCLITPVRGDFMISVRFRRRVRVPRRRNEFCFSCQNPFR